MPARSFHVQQQWAKSRYMSMVRAISRFAVIALCSMGQVGGPGVPAVLAGQGEPMLLAAADCYGIAQRIAAERGGQVHSAEAASRDGRPVCVIVVLVPGKGGQRGRRMEIVVSAD
jgi:hypothetical protein